MTNEVIGIKVKGGIIVSHRPSEIILIITCQGTVDVVTRMLWQKMDTLTEELLSLLPLLSGQTDNGSFCPDTAIVRIKFQTLVKCLYGFRRIFLQ